MEELAAQQEQTGTQILSIISNYKKDPLSRKTVEYYRERLKRLQEAWDAFETTDTVIRTQHSDQLQHAYFTKEYYEAISKVSQTYLEEFKEKLTTLEQKPVKPSMNKKSTDKTTDQGEKIEETTTRAHSHQGDVQTAEEISKIMRKQTAVLNSLHRLLARMDQTEQQLSRQAYEGKVSTINRYWCQIEALHHNIWELTDNPTTHGYNSTEYFNMEEQVQDTLINLSKS